MKINKLFFSGLIIFLLIFVFFKPVPVSAEVFGGEGMCFTVIGNNSNGWWEVYFYDDLISILAPESGSGIFPTTCEGVGDNGGGYTPSPCDINPAECDDGPVTPGPFSLSVSSCYGGPDAYGNGNYDLDWTDSSDAEYYEVWVRPWTNGGWTRPAIVTESHITATMPAGTDWYFQVYAVNDSGSRISDPTVVGGTQCEIPPASPPVCGAVGPINDLVDIDRGTTRRWAYNVSNATEVRFATWSNTGGQNDIIWHSGTNAGGGKWYVDIPFASHPPADYPGDSVPVHVYAFNDAYPFPSTPEKPGTWCGAANFGTVDIPAPSCSSVSPTGDTILTTQGTTRRHALGVSNAIQVLFYTWSNTGGQNDMRAYEGVQSGSTWFADVPISNHPPANSSGDYVPVHVWMNGNSYPVSSIFCADAGFTTVQPPPVVDWVAISSPVVANNNATPYEITVAASDPLGGGRISHGYALINYQGDNAGHYRGYLTWYSDPNYAGWNGLQDKMVCGGGVAAIQPDYGAGYIHLDNCRTSVVGNTKYVTFNVRFTGAFTAPITGNDISGLAYNPGGNSGWQNSNLNFGIIQPPAGLTLTCPAPYNVVYATWNAPTNPGAFNTYYFRANTGLNNYAWPPNLVQNDSVAGGSASFAATPGQPYSVYVHTRDVVTGGYSVYSGKDITCPLPDVPTVDIKATVWNSSARNVVWAYENHDGPIEPYPGAPFKLSWTSTNTTSCTLNGASKYPNDDNNTYNAGGSGWTQTYTFTCTGPGGTATDSVIFRTPPAPTNLSATCSAPGTAATMNWTLPTGYTLSYVRVVDNTTGGNYVFLIPEWVTDYGSPFGWSSSVGGNPAPTPGHTYSWWVHTRATSGGHSDAVYGNDFTCLDYTPPTITSLDIKNQDGTKALNIKPDDSTVYDIVLVGSDPSGNGANISHEFAFVNHTGSHPESPRGYLIYYYDTNYHGWDDLPGKRTCTSAGGIAALNTGGDGYLTLVGCNSTISGSTRQVIFAVKAKTVFTTPVSDNDISSFIQNVFGKYEDWKLFDLNFGLLLLSGNFSGSLSCSIPANASQCSISVDWTTNNPQGTSQVRNNAGGVLANGNSGTISVNVPYPGRDLYLYNNGVLLDQEDYTSSCTSGTSWDPVDGRCETIVTSGLVTVTSAVIGGIVKSTSPSAAIDCVSPSDSTHNVCSANFNLNSTVTLTATPSSSYWRFSQWSSIGSNPVCSGSTNSSCSFTLDGDKTATAIFVPRSFNYKEF